MATTDSLDYYAGRAERERVLAEQASLAEVRRIHLDMAARYAQLAKQGHAGRPVLSIVPA